MCGKIIGKIKEIIIIDVSIMVILERGGKYIYERY